MDYKAMLALALPLGLAITAFGTVIALGRSVAAAMDATARQPEASMKILINMATGCAFIEAITIYILVFAFTVSGKI
jgi:F-type H+-transporting ATPase subunit c